jgi:uncharacterized protein (TIGR00730 family)
MAIFRCFFVLFVSKIAFGLGADGPELNALAKPPSRRDPSAAGCFEADPIRRAIVAPARHSPPDLTTVDWPWLIGVMSKIRNVCVYCGSGPGTDPAFVEAAVRFGAILAAQRIGLVYGGGSRGLMGAIATTVLDAGGHVTGIIPEFLTGREQVLSRAQEVIVTHDMHERKRLMFERADAFVALPGGVGTLEELVEQMTWAQLGRHRKPILIANIRRFWDPLLALIDHMKALAFIRPELAVDLLVVDRAEDILPRLIAAARSVSEPEAKADIGRL